MRALLLVTFAFVASCSHTTATGSPPVEPNAPVAKAWEDSAAIIGRATRLHVARVSSSYPFVIGPEVSADGLTRKAAEALLTRSAFLPKLCAFQPGVALRFCDDQERCARVLLCFSCNDAALDTGQMPKGTLDFTAAREDLASIAKQALPDDPEIQKL